jgi:hypothetical protein
MLAASLIKPPEIQWTRRLSERAIFGSGGAVASALRDIIASRLERVWRAELMFAAMTPYRCDRAQFEATVRVVSRPAVIVAKPAEYQ